MPTRQSPLVPSVASERFNLAERFASFADYAASTASLPQTVATSLDVARFHAFTGELTLAVEPAVRLYLDGGSVYHAEREGGPAVARTMLDAGVIDSMQLQRGVVVVGDVEHLGRLFDRDSSVDRDAVMVVVEGATAALVHEIANSVIATITVSAYRHHPSGIHRWFVAPVEPTGAQRPSSGMTQVDRSVVDDLPRLGSSTQAREGTAAASMRIEWADPDPSSLGTAGEVRDHSSHTDTTNIHIDIQAELDRFDADRADWAATSGGNDPDASEAIPSPLGEFYIVWPDGTRDASIITGEATGVSDPALHAPALDAPPPLGRAGFDPPTASDALPAPTGPSAPVEVPVPSDQRSFSPAFATEPMQIERLPAPDAPVPADVAAAVRRALQAIEGGSSRSPNSPAPLLPGPALVIPPLPTQDLAPPIVQAPVASAQPQAEPPVATPLGFAPPMIETRAETFDERADAEDPSDALLHGEPILSIVEPIHPEPDTSSVDRDPASTQDRRGALRRLIGSLRNKD